MKECSKVWHKCRHPGDTISSKYTFHCGWRAALKWVLEECTETDEDPYGDLRSFLDRTMVEEELDG